LNNSDNVPVFSLFRKIAAKNLKRRIKKAGIWEEVSGLTLSRLIKLIENEALDKRTRSRLMRFGEEVDEVKVRLVKKEKR